MRRLTPTALRQGLLATALALSSASLAACATAQAEGSASAAPAGAATPQAVVDELLAADRAFSAAAAQSDTVTGLSAMFDEAVVMPLPTGTFARSRTEAIAALRGNPFNLESTAQWTPIRGGLSADGQHGFTFGYMILNGRDGSQRLAKYLAYWVRRPDGWRVAVYKRAPRPEGEVSLDMLPPALSARLVAPISDEAILLRHQHSLDSAERAFSDEAQLVGLREAFQRHGSADAMNMGGGPSFAIGLEAIRALGQDPPAARVPLSPVAWAPDDLLVASSGDLGVTWGRSHANSPVAEGQPATQLFVTVWRRSSPSDRWRYIAE